jgi:hypothetical protein
LLRCRFAGCCCSVGLNIASCQSAIGIGRTSQKIFYGFLWCSQKNLAFYGFLWLFMAFTQKSGFLWNSHQTDDFGVPGISKKLSSRKKILFVAESGDN